MASLNAVVAETPLEPATAAVLEPGRAAFQALDQSTAELCGHQTREMSLRLADGDASPIWTRPDNLLFHRPLSHAKAIFVRRAQSIRARPSTSLDLQSSPPSSRRAVRSDIPRSREIQIRRIRRSAARLRLSFRTGTSQGWDGARCP